MQAALINSDLRASVIGSMFQTEFVVLQIGEAVCLMGKQLQQINLNVTRERKIAPESTYISWYSKGECYHTADHKGAASRLPFVHHSCLVGGKLEFSAAWSKTLRKRLGSVGRSEVIHSFDRY